MDGSFDEDKKMTGLRCLPAGVLPVSLQVNQYNSKAYKIQAGASGFEPE
jgi:hypothetical protein